MRTIRGALTDRSLKLFIGIVFIAALLTRVVPLSFAQTPYTPRRSDKLSTSVVSAVATHVIGFGINNNTTPLGSIKLEFCSNSPIPEEVCNFPTGFDASAAVLGSQSGETGFIIGPGSNANTLILTRAPSIPFQGDSSYILDNVANPSSVGSYYLRIQTFSSIDATGSAIEQGGTVFAIVGGFDINTEVPPYIRFCAAVTIGNLDCSTATSFFIDFGELRTSQTAKASSEFLAATNAEFGYTVTVSGTTLTSGINPIPALVVPTGSTTGASQFGINLKANGNPAIGSEPSGPGSGSINAGYNIPNQFKYQSGDTLVSVPNSSDNRKYTVSYMANISSGQPAGYYTTTLSFICLANF